MVREKILCNLMKSYKSNFHNGFPRWIDNALRESSILNVQTHQAIPSKYISTKTPYRGILLYHGLGTGKTRSAISIAENSGFKDIIVILPAALKQNFIKELQLHSGLSAEEMEILLSKYSFIPSNGLTQKKLSEFGANHFDNKLIIIDEVHNITSGLSNPKSLKYQLYNKLLKSNNSRFVLMSATPIINKPVEIAFIINLLRGEQTVYSIDVKGVPTQRYLKKYLMENRYVNTSEALLSGDNVMSLHFTLTPNEFIKTDGMLFKLKRSQSTDKRLQSIRKKLTRMKTNSGKNVKLLRAKFQTKTNFALPSVEETFDSMFSGPETSNIFKRRIAGSVSYFKQQEDDARFADINVKEEKILFSDHQFDTYKDKRSEEIKTERSNTTNSVYKAYSRAVCNFAFPADLQRPFPKDFRGRNLVLNELDEESAAEYAIDEPNEKKSDEPLTKKSEYNDKIKETMLKLKEMDDLDLSIYSPKFKRVVENVEKSDGISMIYTDFRKVEGIGILKLIFEKNGYGGMEIYKDEGEYRVRFPNECTNYFIDYGSKSTIDSNFDKISLMILNNEFDRLKQYTQLTKDLKTMFKTSDLDNTTGKIVNLIFLTRSGSEGISLKNVRDVHILEPYWNNIRIEQVIGRAVRMDSHADLEPGDRFVTVYKYTSIFSPEQKAYAASNKFLKTDEGKTTDEKIQNIAERKSSSINRFLKYLQESSIDCRIHNQNSDVKCLEDMPDKSSNAKIFEFDIDSDAIVISDMRSNSTESLDHAFKVKFKKGPLAEKKLGFIYLPSNETLFDPKSGVFQGTMKKITKGKYKIDLVNSIQN